MKLFQRLLVAPTALTLLAPLTANANEININGISNYSDEGIEINSNSFSNSSITNSLLAGGEGLVDSQDHDHIGSFSETTTLDGKAIFSIGAVDYSKATETATEAAQAKYTYQMNLNTSFTGDDNLYVRIKSGNHSDWSVSKDYGSYLGSGNSKGDVLTVDKIWYEFPVGDRNTVWVGPKVENYYMHGTTPSIYQPVTKQFTLGGNGYAYGASTSEGAGWAYKADNGFAVSSNFTTKSKSTKKVYDTVTVTTDDGAGGEVETEVTLPSYDYAETGLLTDESKSAWATQVGYTTDRYSASVIANIKSNGWSDSYYNSGDVNGDGTGNSTSIGLRGWWRPEAAGTATPSISLGYDTTEHDGASSDQSNSSAWFAGFNWQDMFQADDKIGIAVGGPTVNESDSFEPFAYELYYSFKPNDSVTVTPAVFGGTDRNGKSGGDATGVVVETTFKF